MAIIGFGKSANRYHIPYIKLRNNIAIKMICSRDISKKGKAEYENAGCTFVTNIKDICNDKSIELVSVTTPAPTHYEIAKQLINTGKNVIVEKPFCETLEQAKELLSLAKEKQVMVIPFQNRRFDSDYLALKYVVEKGFCGELLEIESHFDYYRPIEKAIAGTAFTGAFYGLGIHTIDRMIALFGRPVKVTYDIRGMRAANTKDDYFEIDLHYRSSFKVKIKTSHLVASAYPQFILHGTKGSFIKYGIDQQENDLKAGIMPGEEGFGADSSSAYGKLRYQNQNGDWIEKDVITPVGDYGKVYDYAYETIVNGTKKLVSDEEVLMCIEILESGYKSPSPSVYNFKQEGTL